MQGFIVKSKAGHTFVRTKDNVDYFCHISEIPMDDVGRRLLLHNDEIIFDPAKSDAHKTLARNIQIVRRAKPITEDYKETGTVVGISRQGDFCFLARPGLDAQKRSHMFLHQSKVTDRSVKPIVFAIGQQWTYNVIKDSDHPEAKFRAINAVKVV